MPEGILRSSEVSPPNTRAQQAITDGNNRVSYAIQETNSIANNNEKELKERQQRYRIAGAINTDYESSAVEDDDSFSALSIKYKNAEFAFLSYSRTNKLEKLQAILDAKLRNEITLDLNFKGQQKQNFSWSALHLACYFGHTTVVEQLLSHETFRKEIDINIQNNSGDTPLHKATLTNRATIVQLLLAQGANVFIKNCDDLLAKQLTSDKHILNMLEAAEETDRMRIRKEIFKAVDNGDLSKVQEYFNCYNSQTTSARYDDSQEQDSETGDTIATNTRINDDHQHSRDTLSQMTDERGNTLLHLATMRGFKAICVFLLEHGLDAYRKNNLGQTCLDLASHQLRQLFKTVKPTNSHLKKLSKQMVTRFEGPLLKKVRILGWRQIYAVLENGVILLFNNRVDSMNKSRRGYKYLESATCEPDLNDVGTFTLTFSDKSRAIFTVTSDHLNNYTCFKSISEKSPTQIELIRQKWIDSIRDHIKYSTEFIRNGLKINDDDEKGFPDSGDLATVNHLLPIDTIKSFIQEARAHYSILERHAESLCNLVQTINSSGQIHNSLDLSSHGDDGNNPAQSSESANATNSISAATNASGNRLFGLIKSSKQNRVVLNSGEDALSASQSGVNSNTTLQQRRVRNNSLTNEFMQDNWHCLLFHLHLLVESTENTKISMSQALALMEHQEQLRQERIQDQEERCRVLEDSLHALARDHHELEKSISTSQIYHSAAARSISMSTDLNEYFDAFEDFDDEKTMTPNSMPSDDDLDLQIQEVMNEVDGDNMKRSNSRIRQPVMKVYSGGASQIENSNGVIDEDEDEDDLRSNCSALTAETVSEQQPRVQTVELSANNNCGLQTCVTSRVLTGQNRCR